MSSCVFIGKCTQPSISSKLRNRTSAVDSIFLLLQVVAYESNLIGCLASIAPSAASLAHLHTYSMRHGLCACYKSQLLTTMGTRPGSNGAYLYASALPLRQFLMECSVLGRFGLRSRLLHRNVCTCLVTLYEWHDEFAQVTSFSLVGVNANPGHDRDPPSYN
jgi:hypothetical protein